MPLADVEDAGLIPQAILAALGERPDPAREPLRQAAEALSQAATLLVLDNFERLVGGGDALVFGLLERTPGVEMPRHIPPPPGRRGGSAPWTFRPCRSPRRGTRWSGWRGGESVRLFTDRAQARAPEFQVTERNREAVAGLVRGLEGIPLALEMAAAWAGGAHPRPHDGRADGPVRAADAQQPGRPGPAQHAQQSGGVEP